MTIIPISQSVVVWQVFDWLRRFNYTLEPKDPNRQAGINI